MDITGILLSILCTVFGLLMSIIDESPPTFCNDFFHSDINPTLNFQPQLNANTQLIRVKSREKSKLDPDSYVHYVRQLDEFLSTYLILDKRQDKIMNCDANSDLDFLEKQFYLDKVCRFEIVEMLGPQNMCNQLRNYEYDKSKACVLLKLNEIYGWKPEAYDSGDPLPNELEPYESYVRANPRNVFILCAGVNQVDLDFTGEIVYFSLTPDGRGKAPIGYIPFYYFPYRNQDGYRSPLVFAYFRNITTNVLVNVNCRAYAKNLQQINQTNIGFVNFQLMIS